MTGASSAAGAALAWLPAFPALVSSVALVMTAVNLGICRRARPLAQVLASRSREQAAPTFSASGLYFLGPQYDAHLDIPTRTPAMDWLP